MNKFNGGQIITTASIADEAQQSEIFNLLGRHFSGDWGVVSKDDKKSNDKAIAHEGDQDKQDRVLSAYELKNGKKVWIITEWDRSATTVLYPNEY